MPNGVLKPSSSTDIPSRAKAHEDSGCNFGKWGWSIVVMQGALFWFTNGATNDGLNVIVPALSQRFHIDPNVLLFWATPAALGTVVAGFAIAWLCRLISTKYTIILTLIVCAICFGLLGVWGGIIPFIILFFGISFSGSGCGFVAGPVMITRWFPKKKELALGWATMGQGLSSATFVPLLAFLLSVFGIEYGFMGISIGMLVLAAIGTWLITDTPEERGCTPDNLPVRSSIEAANSVETKKGIPMRELLKSRDLWLIAAGCGGVYILLTAVMGQLVPRLMALGVSQKVALSYLAATAVIGIPGSYFWGWLGHRMGVRSALVFYCVWWLVALILNIVSGDNILLYISLFMIGLSLGGGTNLTTSISAEKFQGENFIPAFSIITPVFGILRCFAFAILAAGLTYLGGYTGAYALLVIVAIITAVLFWMADVTPISSKNTK